MTEPEDADEELPTDGWDAITAALEARYPGQTPRHWGVLLSSRLGGSDFLDGTSAYLNDDGAQPRHWHYISFGMSELYDKETDAPDVSGWGFEFSFRLAAGPDDVEPPQWPLSLLQNLARYVCTSGNPFAPGHYAPLNGPIHLDAKTDIWAVLFALDPALGTITTPNGGVGFLQLVGVTMDELAAARGWNTDSFLRLMQTRNPLLVTDITRASVLTDPQVRLQVAEGTARDGSSSSACHTKSLSFGTRRRLFRSPLTSITLGASSVEDVRALLTGRIPFQRPFSLVAPKCSVEVTPGDAVRASAAGQHKLGLVLTADAARALAGVLKPVRGEYTVPSAADLLIQVVPSEIRDAKGERVVEVIG